MKWPEKFSKEGIRNWAVAYADKKEMTWLLALTSFSESSFFIIPPDVVLMGILMSNNKRWVYYSVVTILSSVLGGIFGYLIGLFFFDTIGQLVVSLYGLESELTKVGEFFADNATLAIFLSAFTPIPYKVFTISAGFFKINFLVFILASLAGRGLRYFIIGGIMRLYGPGAGRLFYKYFNGLTFVLALVALIVIAYFYFFV